MSDTDYTRICFVIMPFGEKDVGDERVDFDRIYDRIFQPAIVATPLPEGGTLEARRTDRDFFSGNISTEMFHYLEYSRFALADISGLNANVFYELGHRHQVQASGTAIFRQTEAPIPFDIAQIKAFPYEYLPDDEGERSRELVTRVLTESLEQNRVDSPIQSALAVQRRGPAGVEARLEAAENALRNRDPVTAIENYRQAAATDERNPLVRVKLGLLLKSRGDWSEALEQFTRAVVLAPGYAEAQREKGIAENKLYAQTGEGADGEESLRRAIEANPNDFDALASLGGVLKRAGRLDEALEAYRRSTEVSKGHSYPLLNALKLEARAKGELTLDAATTLRLRKAERSLAAQAANDPPYNAPWSLFDLAEIRLYLGNREGFLEQLQAGLLACDARWQAETFRSSLQLLADGGVELDGLGEGIAALDETIPLMN